MDTLHTPHPAWSEHPGNPDHSLDIARILDIDQPYDIARKQFEKIITHIMKYLWLLDTSDISSTYKDTMNHYLRNSWSYIIIPDSLLTTEPETIKEYKNDYTLFLSVYSRIINLSNEQQKEFLLTIKKHHDNFDQETENPIVVMDTILSNISSS